MITVVAPLSHVFFGVSRQDRAANVVRSRSARGESNYKYNNNNNNI